MAPNIATARSLGGTEVVRARLLTSLHVGGLGPGDRVPSVRRLADLTGLNRKTIHRAYTALAREGLLEVRPGSGTFIAGHRARGEAKAEARDLVSAIERMRAEAAALGLEPALFAAFLQAAAGDALAGIPLAVVECNREQAGMIEADLAAHLGVAPFRVPLQRLRSHGERVVRGARAIVTTDCHFDEVATQVRPTGLPVHPVSFDASFPKRIIGVARRHPVALVVQDAAFGPVFFRLLRQLGANEATLEHLTVIPAHDVAQGLGRTPAGTSVWLSPLVRETARFLVPRPLRLIRESWHVPREILERVRADLAFDHACRDAGRR